MPVMTDRSCFLYLSILHFFIPIIYHRIRRTVCRIWFRRCSFPGGCKDKKIMESEYNISPAILKSLCGEYLKNNLITPQEYECYNVKRGLRNPDGSGVVAGLTHICNVHGYVLDEGDLFPVEGELTYRGYDICDLVNACVAENRYGFEEVVWLLLMGNLPTAEQLDLFDRTIAECRDLPENFLGDIIMRKPSPDVMNMMARGVLALYAYDSSPEDTSIENVMKQSIRIIARMPSIMISSYLAKTLKDGEQSINYTICRSHSTAEAILYALRPDHQFTPEEAHLLDICLMLHADHGGGNNSAFTTRVLSSSGTDTYAAISAAIGSLKGPRHGGANAKVNEMIRYIKEGVKNWYDDREITEFLKKIMRKEAGDGSGLIYGMGHAVYTLSDPRAIILRENARSLAQIKGMGDEFHLLEAIERLAPDVFYEMKGRGKIICANVDLYSGFVYRSLGIPEDLFTPLFSVSRVSGWCAHRIEELLTGGRIIRPAYKSLAKSAQYLPLKDRTFDMEAGNGNEKED